MALSSALFSGISGLSTLGNAMQIIGDNIANVNTVGFKGSSFTFQDLMSQSVATMAGTSQVGRGTTLSDISSCFEQGSFESTGSATDLAIGGEGFFVLREGGSENLYYSRAGSFHFDMDGYMTNPEGYVVQGWKLDENGEDIGSITDILLESFTSHPEETNQITVITNLDSDAVSQTAILSSAWDGTNATPIDNTNYDYQSSVKVYDSLGSTHDITIYYDKISGSEWAYIITCNPDEDLRTGFAGTAGAGLLARGEINFNESSGELTGISMSLLSGTTDGTDQAVVDSGTGTYNTGGGSTIITVNNPEELVSTSDMTATWDNTAGTWSLGFTGGAYGTAVVLGTSSAEKIEVDLDADGAADITIDLTPAISADGTVIVNITGSSDWTAQGTNSNGYFEFTADFIGSAMTVELNVGTQDDGTGTFTNNSLCTTQFASSSTTSFQAADGYGAGDLQGVTVDVDGVITGSYSNGQLIPLYRVALAKFQNPQGLSKEGGNLFSETRTSGDAITNKPGTCGLGSISPNSLEQSNVDIANEFVKMITTQRGFQANSKVITVTDQMLAELINLKR